MHLYHLHRLINCLFVRQYVLIFSLFIISYTVDSQSLVIDSLKNNLEYANGERKIDVLNALMEKYICKNDSIAIRYYENVKRLLKLTDYPKGKLTAMKYYGSMKYCMNDLDSAIFYLKMAASIGVNHSIKPETSQLFSKLGFYFQTASELDSSEYYFHRSLSIGIL